MQGEHTGAVLAEARVDAARDRQASRPGCRWLNGRPCPRTITDRGGVGIKRSGILRRSARTLSHFDGTDAVSTAKKRICSACAFESAVQNASSPNGKQHLKRIHAPHIADVTGTTVTTLQAGVAPPLNSRPSLLIATARHQQISFAAATTDQDRPAPRRRSASARHALDPVGRRGRPRLGVRRLPFDPCGRVVVGEGRSRSSDPYTLHDASGCRRQSCSSAY